jgi:hypothetical protein
VQIDWFFLNAKIDWFHPWELLGGFGTESDDGDIW